MEKDTTSRDLGHKNAECRICGAKGKFPSYLAKEMMQNKKEEFTYFACSNCGCLQIDKVPENLGEYYGKNYYSFRLTDEIANSFVFPEITHNTSIMDVGCGSGVYLTDMAKQGYGPVYGCDPNIDKDINYQDRVFIKKATIHEIEGSFDFVRMSNSFEHMEDPHEVMESVRRLLKPNGCCYIEIPVFPNVAFDLFGPYWYQLDAPRHIFLHSKQSMTYLASKHGLKVTKIEYDSNNSQFVRSTLYQYGIPFWEQTEEVVSNYFTTEQLREMDEKSHIFNQAQNGDHAVFILMHEEDEGCNSVLD